MHICRELSNCFTNSFVSEREREIYLPSAVTKKKKKPKAFSSICPTSMTFGFCCENVFDLSVTLQVPEGRSAKRLVTRSNNKIASRKTSSACTTNTQKAGAGCCRPPRHLTFCIGFAVRDSRNTTNTSQPFLSHANTPTPVIDWVGESADDIWVKSMSHNASYQLLNIVLNQAPQISLPYVKRQGRHNSLAKKRHIIIFFKRFRVVFFFLLFWMNSDKPPE